MGHFLIYDYNQSHTQRQLGHKLSVFSASVIPFSVQTCEHAMPASVRVLAGRQAPEPRLWPGWGPSCAPDIGGSVAAGPLERALEHDGDKDHTGSNGIIILSICRFCSSPCCSPVVMARNIQLRWTFAFFQKYVTMMMMLEIDPISQTAWFSTKLFVRIYLGIIQLQFLLMMHGFCIKSIPSDKKNVCFDEWTRERSMEETFLR